MDSAKISAVVKPILKKLHPDLFFHLNSTADKESIADINKKCILNIQNIWTQIFYYDKVFMIPLLSAVTLKGSVELDNEHDKLDPEYETLQKHLDALHPERKFTWQLPMSRYLESEYCLDCYHFSRSQHTDSSADVKKIQFTLKIPSIFLRSPSNSQNLGQITAATYIKSFNSLLTQQGQFFDLLQLHFPYQRNCDLLNDYLQQVDAAEAFTAFATSRMTFSEALSTKQKAALHSRLMLEQHYYRKSKDFSEFLQWEGKKIMEEIKKKRAGQPSRISPIILENLDLIVKAYRTKVPKMIMNQINYFLHTNHVRFQRVPQREEAALLLTLQSFFIRYHDVLLFDYSHYKSIFILVYWNESVQRRGGDLYQCHSLNSDEMPQVVREGFASHSPEGKKTYDSEEKQNKHYYILRVPHNFIPSDFTNFISENIPISALRLLDAA